MARPLIMAICVLVILALPRFTYGSPAIGHSRSALNTLLTRDSKPEDFPNHKQRKAIITSIVRESASIPVKSRHKRLSDQRLAELETLITLSLLSKILSEARYKRLDPATLGRRKRATTRLISLHPLPIIKQSQSSRE